MKRKGRKSKSKAEDASNGVEEKSQENGDASEREEEREEDREAEEPEDKKKKGAKRKSSSKKVDTDDESEEENAQYEVEQVLDEKTIRNVRHFLIRWKGYEPESDTWEPESTLNCPELIADFKSKQKKKSSSPSKTSVSPKKKKKTDDESEETWDENEDFEVERILDVYFKKNGKREFLVSWKGYPTSQNSWEPEDNMDCKDLIKKFMDKVEKARSVDQRELRVNRAQTNRLTLMTDQHSRRLSKRNRKEQRVHYYDAE